MFNKPFSFEGRIRRTEYGLSLICYVIAAAIINLVLESSLNFIVLIFAYIPMLWFLWAQGAKRCHDLGNSGWWQIIPLYGLWLIFQSGHAGQNEFGDNPKGIQAIGDSSILDDSFTRKTGEGKENYN